MSGIVQRALLELVVLGAACGALGVWVLHFRQAYAAESLAHAMLPGLVLASLAGAPLVLGAAGGVVVAALLVALAGRDRRLGGEIGVAITVSALFGLGVVLAAAPDVPARIGELLFGDPLGVSTADVAVAAGLGVVVLVALAVGARPLRAAAFDPRAAPSLGIAPARVEAALLAVLGLAIVAAAQGLGNLLLVALLIAPAAAAQRATQNLTAQLRLAAGLGALAGAAGLWASQTLDVAAGPAVALAACLTYAGAALARPGPRAARTPRSPVETLTGS